MIERSRYGTQHFQFTGRVVQFYIIYGVAVALVIGTGLLVGVTVGAGAVISVPEVAMVLPLVMMALGLFGFLLAYSFFSSISGKLYL